MCLSVYSVVILRLRSVGVYTRMAASPFSGQRFSQMPQPMQRSRTTTGRRTSTVSPVGAVTVTSSRMMAFSGTGHISSHTRQLRLSAQGRQRFWSMYAWPITASRLSSRARGGIAPVGQAPPQALQP